MSGTPSQWSRLKLEVAIWLQVAAFGSASLVTRRRVIHATGVSGAGRLEFTPDPRLPPHVVFRAGPAQPVRFRFANTSRVDDASLDGRAVSLILPEAGGSGLHLSFSTGRQSIWPHLSAFLIFIFRAGLLRNLRSYFEKHYPQLAGNLEELFRRAPSSYAELSYWSQIAHRWRSTDGRALSVRFRMVPPGFRSICEETGYPDAADRGNLYAQDRRTTEVRPTNYLRDELRERMTRGPVEFDFEVQLRPAEIDDVLNPSRLWPEDEFPWLRVGRLRFDRADPEPAAEKVRIDPGRLPPGLELIKAGSMTQPASLGYARARVYNGVSALRSIGLAMGEGLRKIFRCPQPVRWAWHVGASLAVFAPIVVFLRRRGTHGAGVYAAGRFTALPNHEFWPPDAVAQLASAPAIVRHANSFLDDDMGADVRGLAVEIRGADGRPYWDLMTNTGVTAEWANVPMWTERLWGMALGRGHVYFQRHPEAIPNAIRGLRRAPASYADLFYYSQVTLQLALPAGPMRLFRLRILREGLERESGVIQEDVNAFWPHGFKGKVFCDRAYGRAYQMKRDDSETRPADALRREFLARVSVGPVTYVVQAQLRPYEPDPRHAAYNPMVAWDEREFPWQAIGRLEVNAPLAPDAPKPRGFTLAVHPSFIVVPPAPTVDDFTSLAQLRVTIYNSMQRLRGLLRI